MIRLDVIGTPAPKGSARAITIAGRARLVPSSSDTNKRAQAAWVKAIQFAAKRDAHDRFFAGVPISVRVTFWLARPKGHYTKRGLRPSAPSWPTVRPDADKLARLVLDALTGVLWDDDSRIVSLSARKLYADGEPGATIHVWALDGSDARMPDGPNDVPRETEGGRDAAS